MNGITGDVLYGQEQQENLTSVVGLVKLYMQWKREKEIDAMTERKLSRSNSVESSEIRQVVRTLSQQKKEQEQLQVQVIVEERLSDQDSQRSGKSKGGSRSTQMSWPSNGRQADQMKDFLRTLRQLRNSCPLLNRWEKGIFQDGLSKFAQLYGVNNYLTIFKTQLWTLVVELKTAQ